MTFPIASLPTEVAGLVYQHLIDVKQPGPADGPAPRSPAADPQWQVRQAAAARGRFIQVCRVFLELDKAILPAPHNKELGRYVTKETIGHLSTQPFDAFTKGVGRLLENHVDIDVDFSSLQEAQVAMVLYSLHSAGSAPGRAFHSFRFEADLDAMPMESVVAINRAISELKGMARCRNASFAFKCSSSDPDRADPPDLPLLPNLTQVDLSGCSRMEGRLDVSQNRELRQLGLAGCFALTELSDLAGNTRLEVVTLESCAALASNLDLSRCPNLEVLDLRVCGALTGLSDPAANPKLRDLRLAACPAFNGIWDLSKNPELVTLNLSCWEGARGFLDVSRNPKLQELWLAECPGVTGLSDLSSNPALRDVSLEDCTGLANRRQIAEDLGSQWPHASPPPTVRV
ncbi:hypothetical protein [Pigmentiphaga sp.]|uniref:hypothetical protein n=1 Tax=Pigmentiphaga sp. TaxID=1977564 RepID=UPI00128D7D28|nr:hypothetical protein [Pigmentiphaga sp.]MPS27483.1 hypothetical protein [Alcaligenaceae bacterium SAGV5]MPS50609.1 hypothetical protein [Alcaligenaceae bacterium SAGV3]MPT55631.1 hypothetical protein [Alcaligenaceae bacterium]